MQSSRIWGGKPSHNFIQFATMPDLEIFVFIPGDLPASMSMYSVTAHDSTSVSMLKKMVYTENPTSFKGHTAVKLTLWKVHTVHSLRRLIY